MQQVTEKIVKAKETVIPALGLGTWELKDNECKTMVADCLREGYRHVDTAQAYENEEYVGSGLKASGVDRERVFLTTKVWFKDYSELSSSVESSLRKLKTDYVDLLLLHWPVFDGDMKPVLEALYEQKEKGRALAIGVSNFTRDQLVKAQEMTGDELICNQVEYHPFLEQDKMLGLLREHNMALTAYSPLARGKVFKESLITEIANRHGVDQAQITLAWLLNQDQVVAIPKSSSMAHAMSNFKAGELQLEAAEVERLNELGAPSGRMIDPDFAPDWD
jgi:2,5-diketo-D-gluconate reductase B